MKEGTTAALVGLLLAGSPVGAGEDSPSKLTAEHHNAAQTISFRTPADWEVESHPGLPETTEARGGTLVVRFLRREGELGLDAYHVQCMAERLTDPMKAQPQVDYEYDFLQGWIGGRKALDSAFVVSYDDPIEGHKEWRQRNVTVVGEGESICVIGMAPRRVWKKSKEGRELLKAVMSSVSLD